jgi:3,4-dihydroxybenzoyl-citryl-spermidine/N-citryl-spermidine--spermidine ligase
MRTEPTSPTLHGAPTVLSECERRVVRQVVEALLFEGLVTHDRRARTNPASPVHDQELSFRLGGAKFRCRAAASSFSRLRVEQGSVVHDRGVECEELTLAVLVHHLADTPATERRLLSELQQTVNFDAWSRANLTHHQSPRRHLDFAALESALDEGHPYHPSYKTRTGFTLDDHRDYGPEAGRRFQLMWLAVARPHLQQVLPKAHDDFWREEAGESTFARLTARLGELGASWADYSLLPIHPWQHKALQERGLRVLAEAREILPLGAAGDEYQATQSLRTLLNVTRPTRPNIKLSLDVVCTSSRRNLPPHFVCTAPAMSEWIAGLVSDDAYLQERGDVVVLREHAGAIYRPSRGSSLSADEAELLEGLLAVVLRESITGVLEPGESAVPFTAVMVVESDDRPFIADWIDAHGLERWVDRLVDLAVLPAWHLLAHHGIALEAHAQNLILLHRDGWPTRIAVRDFHEDAEYVRDFVRHPERIPDFAAIDPWHVAPPVDEGYDMAEIEALRHLFVDTVYVFTLADLGFLLERFYGFAERDFWARVRSKLAEYAASGVTERERIDALGTTTAQFVVESLLHKKLLDGEYRGHTIENPLRE